MINVLLYFAFKYYGDWEKIYYAIENKEIIEREDIENCLRKQKNKFETIISNNYPTELKKIYKPPFILFMNGNKNLLNIQNKFTIGDNTIKKNILNEIKANLEHDVFVIDFNNKNLIEQFMKLNLKIIAVSDKPIQRIKETELFTKLLEKNNLVISELPDNTKARIDEMYFLRLLIGLSGNIIFTEKIKEDKMPWIKLSYCESLNIFSLKEENYNRYKIDRVDKIWKIKNKLKKN